ncbi:hypothetical protein RFI_04271 [Reticulomyxa filosa]|uniref:Major royal jelly protein n=1 Tax=Reticulomyxa filosa TaxID=46433 RepID=X6P2Q7_RETFI|nr:hypothetical protein RFI_04271 [Reticulomyxa filosa]|eukprot:ETO32845.1 hypothetical protein RFI_04271 [Reticulomyxa filosa]
MTASPLIVYQFVTVDYDWPEETSKEAFINNGSFIVSNNIITGLKIYENRVFVTVPRWKQGVPSTLNEVVVNPKNTTNYVLRPFPSWEMQTLGNCSCLQYVQSMEIDPYGRMWIIDTGRVNFLDNQTVPDNTCPPKFLLWDIPKNQLLSKYTFPNEVAPYNSTFLNDIVVDIKHEIAYISDVLGTEPGAIVVYDHSEQQSHRFADPTMTHDPESSEASTIRINNYTLNTTTSQDGISLSPNLEYVYYCPMASYKLYRIPTSTLRNYTDDKTAHSIQFLGERRSQMDGMTFSNDSVLYFGSFSDDAIAMLPSFFTNVSSQEQLLFRNSTTMQWQDTWAWDNQGYVWWTTNRLHRYFLQNMDWTGGEGANMRVCKMFVGASSYMMASVEHETSSSHHGLSSVIIGLIVMSVVVSILLHNYTFLYYPKKSILFFQFNTRLISAYLVTEIKQKRGE